MAQTAQQKQLIALAVLTVLAASVWYLYYGPRGKPNTGISSSGQYTPINAQDPWIIIQDLEKVQSTEYKSAGRNIFVMGALPAEKAAAGPVKQKKVFVVYNQPQPPAPPPPAELPAGWVFYGYGNLPAGTSRQAFLKEPDDALHIVSEGDLLLNHIKILHIGNERIDFMDINTGQKGSKNLEAPPAA